ncbi:MAG: Membrane protein insertase YidC [Myxococcaceae bacterium]|nr:Membrane protein insertase YidC [Myxococcaceae bacterium]
MQHGMSRSRLLSLTFGAALLAACSSSAPAPTSMVTRPIDKPAVSRSNAALDPSKFVVLESPDFRATITSQTTGLVHYVFKDPRYERAGKQIDAVSTDKLAYLPLSLELDGIDVPANASWTSEQLSPTAARFTLQVGDVTLVRKLEVGRGPFQLWSTLTVHNASAAAKTIQVQELGTHYVRRADEAGGFLAGRSALSASGICVQEDTPKRFDRSNIVEDHPIVAGKVSFGSLDNVYFTQAIAADGTPFERCELSGSDRGGSADKPDGALLSLALSFPKTKLAARGDATFRTLSYVGPKTPNELRVAGHTLRRASYVGGLPGVDSIAHGLVGLLAYIHDHVIGNWGLAIILLTISVKLVLYPLTAKSFQSIGAMRRLKPSIDAINERYADDREKKGAAMMALYKEHKINPFGGCLPQLLQLPIWWALYTSLSTNVELFKRPFFGFWQDLAAPDPYYALPLALGALMWVQQRITPSTMDPAQAKMMMYVMPAMITSFMLFLPAGLCLYMLTNSVLSIGQQRFIEYRLAHKQAAVAAALPTGSADSPSGASNDAASPRRTGRGRA